MMSEIAIAGIGTAVPPNTVSQRDVREVVEALFNDRVTDLQRLLGVFEHHHIRQRHLMQPPSWYATERGFAGSNAAYVDAATVLATDAARRALADAELHVGDIDGLVVVSSTGIMTPSLDAVLAQELGCDRHIMRRPVFGLGCAGGVSGLARAAELSHARDGRAILFVAVEICSATFQRNDTSRSNLVGASLFADGAAAVIVSADGRGPVVANSFSTLFPNTYDIMGWDVADDGLRVRFSRDIPTFVRTNIPLVLEEACLAWGIDAGDIIGHITHPGGAKVLDAYAEAVQAQSQAFDVAREVLYDHGNMSSASVLFVLERLM
ncbi:MAG: stilbene synthase, partial [Ignavibacteriae bacterium]